MEGAEVSVDDLPRGKTPMTDAIIVNAGRRRITASVPGRVPAAKVIEVAGADSVEVLLDLADPTPSATPAATAPVPVQIESPSPAPPPPSQPAEDRSGVSSSRISMSSR
jgi:hypothetical protein